MNVKYYCPFLTVLVLMATPLVALSQDSDIKSLSQAQQQAQWYGEAYNFLNSPNAPYSYGAYPFYDYNPFYPYTSHYPGYSFPIGPTYPSLSYAMPAPVTAPTQAYSSTPAPAYSSTPTQTSVSSTTGYSIMTATNSTLGTYLTDGKGRTLYHLQNDQGKYSSKCTDASCTGRWPPFYSASIKVPQNLNPSDFSTINVNGYKQYQQTAYKGWPLYYFYSDKKSGDIHGQGLQDNYGIWSVVSSDNPSTFPANFAYAASGTTSVQYPTQQQSTIMKTHSATSTSTTSTMY